MFQITFVSFNEDIVTLRYVTYTSFLSIFFLFPFPVTSRLRWPVSVSWK